MFYDFIIFACIAALGSTNPIASPQEYNQSTPSGYTNPQFLNNAAINAPLDCNGHGTYLGVRTFDADPFDINLCAAACTATSQYNVAHPPADGRAPQLCTFFDTYLLYKNGLLLGQYCALYNETWSTDYATNTGQYDTQGNHYTIGSSFLSSNATDPGTCRVPTCSSAFVLQANPSSDIERGHYAVLNVHNSTISNFTTDVNQAEPFVLDSRGHLLRIRDLTTVAGLNARGTPEVVFAPFASVTALQCVVGYPSPDPRQLVCTAPNGRNRFFYCPLQSGLGYYSAGVYFDSVAVGLCSSLYFDAVPVCV